MSEVINEAVAHAYRQVCRWCGHHRSSHPDDGPCHEPVPALTWEADYIYCWCDEFEPSDDPGVRELEARTG